MEDVRVGFLGKLKEKLLREFPQIFLFMLKQSFRAYIDETIAISYTCSVRVET